MQSQNVSEENFILNSNSLNDIQQQDYQYRNVKQYSKSFTECYYKLKSNEERSKDSSYTPYSSYNMITSNFQSRTNTVLDETKYPNSQSFNQINDTSELVKLIIGMTEKDISKFIHDQCSLLEETLTSSINSIECYKMLFLRDFKLLCKGLSFIDTINIFMEKSEILHFLDSIYQLKKSLYSIADSSMIEFGKYPLMHFTGLNWKEGLIKQIKYTENSIIYYKKSLFRKLYFLEYKQLFDELYKSLNQVIIGNEFDVSTFKQLKNIFWVFKSKLAESDAELLQSIINNLNETMLKSKSDYNSEPFLSFNNSKIFDNEGINQLTECNNSNKYSSSNRSYYNNFMKNNCIFNTYDFSSSLKYRKTSYPPTNFYALNSLNKEKFNNNKFQKYVQGKFKLSSDNSNSNLNTLNSYYSTLEDKSIYSYYNVKELSSKEDNRIYCEESTFLYDNNLDEISKNNNINAKIDVIPSHKYRSNLNNHTKLKTKSFLNPFFSSQNNNENTPYNINIDTNNKFQDYNTEDKVDNKNNDKNEILVNNQLNFQSSINNGGLINNLFDFCFLNQENLNCNTLNSNENEFNTLTLANKFSEMLYDNNNYENIPVQLSDVNQLLNNESKGKNTIFISAEKSDRKFSNQKTNSITSSQESSEVKNEEAHEEDNYNENINYNEDTENENENEDRENINYNDNDNYNEYGNMQRNNEYNLPLDKRFSNQKSNLSKDCLKNQFANLYGEDKIINENLSIFKQLSNDKQNEAKTISSLYDKALDLVEISNFIPNLTVDIEKINKEQEKNTNPINPSNSNTDNNSPTTTEDGKFGLTKEEISLILEKLKKNDADYFQNNNLNNNTNNTNTNSYFNITSKQEDLNEIKYQNQLSELTLTSMDMSYNDETDYSYNNHAHLFFKGRDSNIHKEYFALKCLEQENPSLIETNLKNFESKILLPLYKRVTGLVGKKKKKYLKTYYKYENFIYKVLGKKNENLLYVKPYGSFANSFLIDVGDIDICIVPKGSILDFSPQLDLLKDEINKQNLAEITRIYYNQRYMLLKMVDKKTKISIDLTVHNLLPIYNTSLMKLYGKFDQRVHIMGLYIKHWAKNNRMHGAAENYLSSYALLNMLIHFLQKAVEPKVLPVLQSSYDYISDKKRKGSNQYTSNQNHSINNHTNNSNNNVNIDSYQNSSDYCNFSSRKQSEVNWYQNNKGVNINYNSQYSNNTRTGHKYKNYNDMAYYLKDKNNNNNHNNEKNSSLNNNNCSFDSCNEDSFDKLDSASKGTSRPYQYNLGGRMVETDLYFDKNIKRKKQELLLINQGLENTESVASLIVKFFEYYAYYFDYFEHVISIKSEDFINKSELKEGIDSICAFTIEDPFDKYHNPGRSLTIGSKQFNKFVASMKKEINHIMNGEYLKRASNAKSSQNKHKKSSYIKL